MERHLQTLKSAFITLLFLLYAFSAPAQIPSFEKKIRIPVWAELDAYPELAEAADTDSELYDYPIKSIRRVAPFLISGMIYGWKFVYVPSDKARGVEEYLEVTEILDINDTAEKITYTSPWIQNNRLNCWCEFNRSEAQIQNYRMWNSIQHPVIQGRGSGSLSRGFDGIREAAEDALKNAVREHFRSRIKNKPKEIRGSVLIKDSPTVGISSGRYVMNLDFFLEYGRILEYTQY